MSFVHRGFSVALRYYYYYRYGKCRQTLSLVFNTRGRRVVSFTLGVSGLSFQCVKYTPSKSVEDKDLETEKRDARPSERDKIELGKNPRS